VQSGHIPLNGYYYLRDYSQDVAERFDVDVKELAAADE